MPPFIDQFEVPIARRGVQMDAPGTAGQFILDLAAPRLGRLPDLGVGRVAVTRDGFEFAEAAADGGEVFMFHAPIVASRQVPSLSFTVNIDNRPPNFDNPYIDCLQR